MKKNKLLKQNGSTRTTIILVLSLLLFIFIGVFVFRSPSPENLEERVDTEDTEREKNEKELGEKQLLFEEELYKTLDDFIGLPYSANPLDEENLYTEDGFNSTTLILSIIAKTYSEEDPEEVIKKINYYPPGVVSFSNRNHFSTYRNKVSPYFEDVSRTIGGEYTEKKEVTINKKQPDGTRLVDIDWEENVEICYIPVEHIKEVVENLPKIAGVMFLMKEDKEIGLDVRTEGIIIDNKDFVYASSRQGRVVKIDLFDYLDNNNFDGLSFYRFTKI